MATRVLLGTLYDAVVSGISNGLHEAKIFPTPLNRPPFPIVSRDWSIASTVHPDINGTLTTQFSPAAFSITGLDLNIPTPKFKGWRYISRLSLTRPVSVQISGVVLGLGPPTGRSWCCGATLGRTHIGQIMYLYERGLPSSTCVFSTFESS